LKTEYPVLRIFPLFSKRLAFCRQDLPTGSERSTERLNCRVVRLFAMIQKSDYIQITGIRQKDLPPDPWERDFRVRGCW